VSIGRAVVRRLLRERALKCWLSTLPPTRLKELAGPSLVAMVANVAEDGDRSRVAAAADWSDFLVNAAGIIRIKPIFEVTLQDRREIMTINAESIFFLCQLIGPRMTPGGAIVNLSSSSSKLASTIEVAPYAASKTTILSFTRSFAYALANLAIPFGRRSAYLSQ
jgi:NAD(P)-dependent dehydrogenase (short-subunit alcohol dehydrogenase family)